MEREVIELTGTINNISEFTNSLMQYVDSVTNITQAVDMSGTIHNLINLPTILELEDE